MTDTPRQGVAVVPEPEEPERHRYIVTAPHPVLGHPPGKRFVDLLNPEQEARLTERGQIARDTKSRKSSEKEEA